MGFPFSEILKLSFESLFLNKEKTSEIRREVIRLRRCETETDLK
jgi:hypothetical protein